MKVHFQVLVYATLGMSEMLVQAATFSTTDLKPHLTDMYTVLSDNQRFLHTIFNYTRSSMWVADATQNQVNQMARDLTRLDEVTANIGTIQQENLQHRKMDLQYRDELEATLKRMEKNLTSLKEENMALQESLNILLERTGPITSNSIITCCVVFMTSLAAAILTVVLLLEIFSASGSPHSPLVQRLITAVLDAAANTDTHSAVYSPSLDSPPPYNEVPLSVADDLNTVQSQAGTVQALV